MRLSQTEPFKCFHSVILHSGVYAVRTLSMTCNVFSCFVLIQSSILVQLDHSLLLLSSSLPVEAVHSVE